MKQNKDTKIIQRNSHWLTRVKCLCFDLDGTLVDTLEDISDAVNKALEKNNLPTHSYEEYKKFLGHGSKHLIKNAIGSDADEELFKKVYKDYIDRYSNFPCTKSRAYKGITNMLLYAYKTSYHLVVITNKPQKLAEAILKEVFPWLSFDLIIGDDEKRRRKPSPDVIEEVKKTFILTEDEIAYFGDSVVDFEFAKNANILKHYYSFYHGFTSKDELIHAGVTKFIDDPVQIIKFLHKEGGYKENGRLSLSIISFLVLFTIFFTDIGIAFKTWQLWTPSLIALVIGISLMLTFYMPYALKKSYLDYKLYLMCLFYFLGAGTILSAVIAKYNYGNLNYTISIEVYTYVCISLGFIFLIFAITSLCLFFRDRYRYKRKEK